MSFRSDARRAAWVVALAGALACSSNNEASGSSGATGNNAAVLAAGDCPPVGSKACANEPATTQASFDQCGQSKSDSMCGAKYIAYLKCLGTNTACGADGKTDGKAVTACINLYADLSVCQVRGSIDAGVLDAATRD
jgi:hypothetical protein